MAKELLRVEHIGMKFNLSKERVNDFREYVIRMLKGKKLEKDEFWALKDINFSIHEGERIGICLLYTSEKKKLSICKKALTACSPRQYHRRIS